MVSVLALRAVDLGFVPRSSQTKDYKIGICCFSVKYAALRRKNKEWLALNQNNVSEYMSTHGLLFQWASTIKIQLSVLVCNKEVLIIISLKINLFSSWYSWKIAALNNNHSSHSLWKTKRRQTCLFFLGIKNVNFSLPKIPDHHIYIQMSWGFNRDYKKKQIRYLDLENLGTTLSISSISSGSLPAFNNFCLFISNLLSLAFLHGGLSGSAPSP
jgi:hypothetical protein